MFQLLNSNKKTKDKVSQLSDIIDTISMSKDMKELLEAALGKTLHALSSERGSVFLTGDDGQELFLKWAQNMDFSKTSEIRKKVGEGIMGKVAKGREAMLVKDIRHDPRFSISNMYHDYKTNSFLCVPIATDMRLIGVISITENKSRKPYNEGDLRFLKIIAGHIALKIEKSQLLSENERFKKKTEADNKFTDIGKFSAGISHELDNPLDGVIRYVNLALSRMQEGVPREYLLEAKTGLNRITNIVRSLLELTRYRKERLSKSADINNIMEDSIGLLQYQAMARAIDIKKDFYPDLPKVPDMGMESVFSNILKNSMDAMDEKGSINVTTALEQGFIKIHISDTGCGIPKDNIGRIFEPFFTTKAITKGSGLGLSICYDIVKRYNGRIEVVSEPGKGSTFTVYIPYA